MRLSAAIVLAALATAHAHVHPPVAARHEEVVKRVHDHHHLNRAAELERFRQLRSVLNGRHDPRDVPDDYEYVEDPEEEPFEFAHQYEDNWEFPNDGQDANVTNHDVVLRRDYGDYGDNSGASTDPNCKRGLAWTNEVANGMGKFVGQVLGAYSWSEVMPAGCSEYNIPFYPMLKNYAKRTSFKNTVVEGYATGGCILGPNEVNLASQANLSPSKALWLIETYMIPLKNKYDWCIVGPSTANGNSAYTWYDKFKKIAPASVWNDIDAIALHYYGLDASKVTAWMSAWHKRYGKPIWLTEYACHSFTSSTQCSKSQAKAFMETIATFCESVGWCQVQMVYGSYVNSREGLGTVNALFSSSSGTLSSFGKAFIAT